MGGGPPNSPPERAGLRRISRVLMAIKASMQNRVTEKPKLKIRTSAKQMGG